MLKQLLHEPLLHFLLIGAVLFILYYLQNDQAAGDDRNRIVISQGEIDRLGAIWEKRWLRPPTRQELEGLIEGQIREEVLYRQALNLGMDRDDSVVRRRLAQKVEFIFSDIAEQAEPSDRQLETFLQENRETFEIPARTSFVQVYFNADKRGSAIQQDAAGLLVRLAGDDSEVDVAAAGDYFMHGQQYEQLTHAEVAKLFGRDFSQALATLPVGSWQGPVTSGYGLHLVRIDARTPAVQPALDMVRDRVITEWMARQREQMDAAFYRELRQQYEIVVEGQQIQGRG